MGALELERVYTLHHSNIPNVIQESAFGKAGAQNFDQALAGVKIAPYYKGDFCGSKGQNPKSSHILQTKK